MTACAIEMSTGFGDGGAPRAGCAITADGAYAARLALSGGCRYPERWTLDGPEPYAVPLPSRQPEEPGTEVQPMSDGRVLVHRTAAGRHLFALLYPTGPGTGELPLGAVACAEEGARLRLLPPAPGGMRAYALATGRYTTSVWLVAGGADGPERVAEIHGRCSGGAWLDRAGRMLAVNREADGCTKAVVVDLARGGEVSPLLQIAPGSDDRVLLADPDSGLLLIRSDAPSPGRPRLGWGVLGSTLPVRFPECLLLPDCAVTPFAIQPGQALTPEGCAVALRIDGAFGSWVGVWRPAERRVHHLPAPEGWLAGAGLWTAGGALCLPYATAVVPCGLARPVVPAPREDRDGEAGRAGNAGWGIPVRDRTEPSSAPVASSPAPGGSAKAAPDGGAGPAPRGGPSQLAPGGRAEAVPGGCAKAAPDTEADPPVPAAATRPMPLQQAPLGDL
ncbi:hypothetical protein SUDANB6_04220 [Streptomyces sp. enrichment culture]|uniref:hypothetical protein n=1 Tax=Streptomyces sp. enrichment culture TaxID=1795815 RepID=UPI003F552900